MKKFRLYLIDIDRHFLEQAYRYLSSTQDVEVIGYATDSAYALKQIQQTGPDCIVLGLAQKSCYGLALLRILRAIPSQPALIVCTSFSSDTAIQMCRDVGADMFLFKPVPFEQLHACIVDTTKTKLKSAREQRAIEAGFASPSPTVRIRHALLCVGITPRLFGFSCLAEALYRLTLDERLLRNLRRNLYPQIAQTLVTTPENVERNMRTAIRRARGESDISSLSNRQFLGRMLRRLREEPQDSQSDQA